MRIWYQCSTPLGKDRLWHPYEECLKKHIRDVAKPNTTVDVHGLDVVSGSIEKSFYVEYLNTEQWIENACKAEQEGYDAFTGGCMFDLGYLQIKELVDIPVGFAAETSFHVACMLAPKFSLLSPNQALLSALEERVKRYGLWERFVPTSCFDASIEELRDGINTPAPIIKAVRKEAKKAASNGAGILVPSCNILTMVLVNSGVREIGGIPILDNVGTVIKMAELLTDLKGMGITRSKKRPYETLSKQDLTEIRRLIKQRKSLS